MSCILSEVKHIFLLRVCVTNVCFALFSSLVSLSMFSVSLDPDEDKRDTTIFDGLKNYMLNELTDDECQHLKSVTLRNLAKRAQSLKALRPPRGLSFSLQQQRTYEILIMRNMLQF